MPSHAEPSSACKAKAVMDSGELVSDDIVLGLIRERLGRPMPRSGFILDGFPRNIDQANALNALLKQLRQPIECGAAARRAPRDADQAARRSPHLPDVRHRVQHPLHAGRREHLLARWRAAASSVTTTRKKSSRTGSRFTRRRRGR